MNVDVHQSQQTHNCETFLPGWHSPAQSFTPSGMHLLSGSDDHAVILWDWQAGDTRAQGILNESEPVRAPFVG